MGGAMAAGLAAGHPGIVANMVVADPDDAVRAGLAAEIGAAEGTTMAAARTDLVVVAVKPALVAGLLAEIRPALTDRSVVASVAAGRTLDDLDVAGCGTARLMPNLAVRHGAGLVALATRGIDDRRRDDLTAFLGVLGTVTELDEALFDVATALAGSGPGIVALVAEALEQGGIDEGLSAPEARAMVRAVLAGTAALLADGLDPAELRARVSSPGGTTVAAVQALEEGAVRRHLALAVRAAAARSGEL
jgi:pyrroline-5-carboxylate reductase